MKWSVASWRVWLYRVLSAIACGLMLVSFIMPWWTAHITEVPSMDAIRIYGYGLRHSLHELRSYIAEDETPLYQTILAWIYVAVSIGSIMLSTWLKGNKGKWLLGSIGLIYIAYVAVAVFVVVAGRTGDLGISLQGWSTFRGEAGVADIRASLRLGYYLAYSAGLACVLLALSRDAITGERRLGTEKPKQAVLPE